MYTCNRKYAGAKHLGLASILYVTVQIVFAQSLMITSPTTNTDSQVIGYGFPSAAGNSILDTLNKSKKTENPIKANRQHAYFNLSYLNSEKLGELLPSIRELLNNDYVVILDETQAQTATAVNKISSNINGIELNKSLVLLKRNSDGNIYYYSISPTARHEYLIPKALLKTAFEKSSKRSKRNTDNYHVGKTVFLHFFHENISCPVKKEVTRNFWGTKYLDGSFDPCDGKASFNTQVRLDYIPSKNSPTIAATPEGKIVRFSSGLTGLSGAGWHLANSQSSVNTEFTYNGKRNTRFGPFAEKYVTRIEPGDTGITLIDHLPHNKNPNTQITETSTIFVDEGYSASFEINSQGPKVGFQASSLNRRQNQVSVTYNANEYETINSTVGNVFNIRWSRPSNPGLLDSRSSVNNGAWPVRSREFSAISYSNFIPGYIATYLAPFSKKAKSTFKVYSEAEVGMIYTYVPYNSNDMPTYLDFNNISLLNEVTIDWNSPYFLSEVPVILKAHRNRGLYCLTMVGENREVQGQACNGSKAQTWGYTSNNQYLSFENPQQCLSLDMSGNYDRLITKACEQGAHQEWTWGGEENDKSKLINQFEEKWLNIASTSSSSDTALIRLTNDDGHTQPSTAATRSWKPYVIRPE
ncbi:ricin-type beta-trefoil lectin domain protein [Chitinimonas sp. PSY-7]|uniref:ricin-type beta-trefoil lectin domain protein n=1 Tax=Chitinimonas sp. PSY-7 TaxID=3459088 RepID=UPI0040403528